MFLPVTSPAHAGNDPLLWDPRRALTRKRRLEQPKTTQHNLTVYGIKGCRICRHSFAAILQVNVSTLNKNAQKIAQSSTVSPYDPIISNRTMNILSPQSSVATTFLFRYRELNGVLCPTGRGSTAERPLTWLPSDATRQHVYKKYFTSSKDLMDSRRRRGFVMDVIQLHPLAACSRFFK